MQPSSSQKGKKLAAGGKLGREIDISVEKIHKRDDWSCTNLGDWKEYVQAERERWNWIN